MLPIIFFPPLSFLLLNHYSLYNYLYNNTDYFKDIKYLIAEDMDEATPLCFDFVKFLAPQLKDKLIIMDKNGSSRIGYLCAEPDSEKILEEIFDEKIIDNEQEPENVILLTENILNNEKNKIDNVTFTPSSKRLDMIEDGITKINGLLKKGVSPKDITGISNRERKVIG